MPFIILALVLGTLSLGSASDIIHVDGPFNPGNDPVVIHHEPSGLHVVLPPDTPYRLGITEDAIGGRLVSRFSRDEVPPDWNSIRLAVSMGTVSTSVQIYAMPETEMPSRERIENALGSLVRLFGGLNDFTHHDEVDFAGHRAISFDHHGQGEGMNQLSRYWMFVTNDFRFTVTVGVAYGDEENRSREQLEELTRWVLDDVEISIRE